MRKSPRPAESASTRHFPVRVFLLSGFRLLRDMIVRLLKKQPDILSIGAQESSALAVAEMMASSFDVLLADPAEIKELVEPSLDDLRRSSPDFTIVLIDMDAGVADLLSSIRHETLHTRKVASAGA